MSIYRHLAVWTILSTAALAAMGQAASGDGIGKPLYATKPLGSSRAPTGRAQVAPGTLNTVPYWRGSFRSTIKGKVSTFPYTMVGSDPAMGSATTTVPANIVPISLSFSNGTRLDGSTRVQSVIASPIFQSFDSQAGFTQYADAMFRSSFFKIVEDKSPSWHVLLGQPAVMATQYLVVPADKGLEFTGSHSGAAVGLIDVDWFSRQLQQLVDSLKLDPHALTIFLTNNAFLFAGNPGKCCIVGFHSGSISAQADFTQLHTFVWASYNDPKIFDAPLEDVTALSHEIAEWYSDPFLSNVVPSWAQPGTSACTANILEVGDPIQAFRKLSFAVMLDGTVYHPQDAVLFSWFAHQSPSIGIKGRYSYRGDKLFAPAPPCS
ncbi:MAG TPA: hypothetical protein VF011_18550 [Terriglobales bacterium]